MACHLGDGLSLLAHGKSGLLNSLLERIAHWGYLGVRTWTVLHGDYWRGREVGPMHQDRYWDIVNEFVGMLSDHGLGWVVSQGDLMRAIPGNSQRIQFIERLVGMLHRDKVLAFDLGNETWQNGETNPQALAQYAKLVKAAWSDVPLTLSSPQGEEKHELDPWSVDPANCFDVHGYRGGHWWDKIRHIFSIQYEVDPARRTGIQSEPFGPGQQVSASSNKHELNDNVMLGAALMSAMTNQFWVYFSGPGVMADKDELLTNMPGFAATPEVVNLLPRNIGSGKLIHGGTTWARERIFVANDVVRCDHSILSDGTFACLIYGPDGRYVQNAVPQRQVDIITSVQFGSEIRLVIGKG